MATTGCSLLCHLHFWTMKALSPGTAAGGDIGIHSYHDKTTGVGDERDLRRREWATGRGITWTPRNRKPEKLRDTLRECEELLSSFRPICMKWKSLRHCLVLLENGVLLTFMVAKHSGDVEAVLVDKTLVAKLQARADHALVVDSSIVLTLVKDRRPVCVSLSPKRFSGAPASLTLSHTSSGRKLEKLSTFDPKLSFLDVKGMPAGQVERHIVCNSQRDLVVVWWRDTQEAGWQWSSMANSGTHNLIMFRMSGGKLEYACGLQTECDPVDVQFSKCRSHVLYTLEKSDESTYDSCIYEYVDKKLSKRLMEDKIHSKANVVVCERSKDETKQLLGCEDGSLILYTSEGTLQTTKAFFSPISLIRWHPAGSFAFVCSPQGQLQCYDLGLNPLLLQLASEDPSPTPLLQLGSYTIAPARLELAGWGSEPGGGEGHGGCYDNFIMVFDRGPLVLLRLELGVLSRGKLGPVELVSEYIRHYKLEEAVAFLRNMNWNFQPKDCFASLTFIMNHLLNQPLSAKTEAQMEATLETFLAPKRPISRQLQDTYHDHIIHLTRRFFHLLLRYRRLEKAFRLAVDVAARDLFMDIHFVALDCNETKLAQLAKQKAESLSSTDALTDSLQSGVTVSHERSAVLFSADQLQLKHLVESDDDVESEQHDSILSFDSVGSSCSAHVEQATLFESSTDHSSAAASEVEYCSDNEATQEAVEDTGG